MEFSLYENSVFVIFLRMDDFEGVIIGKKQRNTKFFELFWRNPPKEYFRFWKDAGLPRFLLRRIFAVSYQFWGCFCLEKFSFLIDKAGKWNNLHDLRKIMVQDSVSSILGCVNINLSQIFEKNNEILWAKAEKNKFLVLEPFQSFYVD